MRLFIAEKPAVANDIVKALGGNFTRHPKTIILNTKSGRLKHSLCVFIP